MNLIREKIAKLFPRIHSFFLIKVLFILEKFCHACGASCWFWVGPRGLLCPMTHDWMWWVLRSFSSLHLPGKRANSSRGFPLWSEFWKEWENTQKSSAAKRSYKSLRGVFFFFFVIISVSEAYHDSQIYPSHSQNYLMKGSDELDFEIFFHFKKEKMALII